MTFSSSFLALSIPLLAVLTRVDVDAVVIVSVVFSDVPLSLSLPLLLSLSIYLSIDLSCLVVR